MKRKTYINDGNGLWLDENNSPAITPENDDTHINERHINLCPAEYPKGTKIIIIIPQRTPFRTKLNHRGK